MSYNYDQNPWDDNYNNEQTAGYGPSTGYNAASGYSNPSVQHQEAWGDQAQQQPQQQHYDGSFNNQQSTSPNEQPLDSSQAYGEQDSGAAGRQPSALRQFLRARVPMCGTCMDITAPLFDTILKYVNRDLLVSKIFYFFFYSAFGSLFPLMGVYFKQLGMNPAQVGIITGVRPFIEIFSAPFWNSLAERFQKSKMLLLFSLLSWIVFTYSLAHIRPPASACVAFNDTDYVLYTPYSANDLSNYDLGQEDGAESASSTPASEPKEATNEVFLNKMPSNNREGKDEILVNEENVNDQGRRRRRRKRSYPAKSMEQIARPALLGRPIYAIEDIRRTDEGYQSHADLDIDLENDFFDSPTKGNGVDLAEASFFDSSDASPEFNADPNRDELEQQLSYANKIRNKRDLSAQDEMPGESEADEPEEGESKHKYSHERSHTDDDSEDSMQAGANSGSEGSGSEGSESSADENEVEASKKARTKHSQHNTSGEQTGGRSEESSASNKQTEIAEQEPVSNNKTKRIYKQRHKTPPTHINGMSPITVEYAINYNKEKHSQFVTPMFSTIVYKLDDIKEVFFLLLLLISLGEFFSAPAVTIADSITLSSLGENTDLYGRQRMFGSIGWGITLLLVGMALDNSKTIADHPCGPHQRERSYTVCFTIFSLLMGCAFLTATQFTFKYPTKKGTGGGQTVVTKTTDNNSTVVTTTVDGSAANVDDLYASTRPREIFNTAPPVNAPPPSQASANKEKFEFLDKWKSAVFAQSTGELPEWVNVFRQFSRTMHLTYLFITWFLGCGVGLVFTFLFWHLQDVGGTPTLFGICSVINHISEILAYFFSSYFIKRFGHTKVSALELRGRKWRQDARQELKGWKTLSEVEGTV